MPPESNMENEDISNQLAKEQNFNLAAQQYNQALQEAQQYRHPSYLKYGFLFAVAGIMDIVDVLDVTGVGIIISKIVSLGGTAMIYLVLFLSNGKIKKAQQYGDRLSASVAAFQAQAARAERIGLRASKILGKVPGLKGIVNKNPLTKILVGGVINLVPFLAIINLMVFWVYLSYRDEKNTYRQAREAASEAAQQFEQTQTA